MWTRLNVYVYGNKFGSMGSWLHKRIWLACCCSCDFFSMESVKINFLQHNIRCTYDNEALFCIPGLNPFIYDMCPYIVTSIVIIITSIRKTGKDHIPESLGENYYREER